MNIDDMPNKLSIQQLLTSECYKYSIIDVVPLLRERMQREVAQVIANKMPITCRLVPVKVREKGRPVEEFDHLFTGTVWVFTRDELKALLDEARSEDARHHY